MTATGPSGATDPTAVVGRRFAAVAIDIGILWVFSAGYWLLASERDPAADLFTDGACAGRGFCTNLNDRYVAGWPLALLALVWLAYMVGVFVLQRGLTGRTVGTMLTGVVVVGPDGRPLGPGKAVLRSVIGVVDYLPCCLPIVGFVTVLAAPGHRRVGDMAADSYVVDNDAFGRPVELPGPLPPAAEAPPPPDGYPAQPPVPPRPRPPVAPAPPAAPSPSAPGTGSPGPFAPPPTTRAGPPAPAAPAPTADGPVWDAQRRAYLQWDPARQEWLQFDQATQQWQQYDPTTGRWRDVDR